ncbi:hypothetical protein Tco_0870504 [Tanacetum coccineum]
MRSLGDVLLCQLITWYVVPTGRVVVPTGRYVVPAGKVIIIVSPGRLSLVPTGRVLSPEETMNLRYLEEKPNVQGLGHEWYFDLDYLTDTLGYKRDKANQSGGTQETSTNPADRGGKTGGRARAPGKMGNGLKRARVKTGTG